MNGFRHVEPDRARWAGQKFTGVGDVPRLAWLPIAKLVIDGLYQRPIDNPISRRNIDLIVKGFAWAKFGTVIVAPAENRKGQFAIIDGQHRTVAAAERGLAEVPCQIVTLAQAEQASAFAAINGNVTPMTVFQVFKAARAAGEPWAVLVDRACARARVTPLVYPVQAKHLKPGETLAIGSLRQVLERHGEEATVVGLSCITGNRNNVPGNVKAKWIRTIVSLVAAHPEWMPADRVIRAFDRVDLAEHAGGQAEAREWLERRVRSILMRMASGLPEPAPSIAKRSSGIGDEIVPASGRRARITQLSTGGGRAGEWWGKK
jgi:hypothetical protein